MPLIVAKAIRPKHDAEGAGDAGDEAENEVGRWLRGKRMGGEEEDEPTGRRRSI